ncbi:MAG: acyltransferase family protein [Clostridia bacterium]|nr:acyltransferase family protein [Clostridia bacterium]
MSDKNYKYIDFIRVFSIFMVILLHCICDYYADVANAGRNLWYVIGYANELARVAVPLFFMISGFLLLSKDITDIKAFYKKRILKIGIPFIAYDIFYYIYMTVQAGRDISVSGFFTELINCGSAYHLWFVYSILFIYLLMPFLQIIVKNCDAKKLIFLFLIAIFQTSIRPLINTFADGRFYLFLADDGITGYIGYVLLGYILGKYDLKKNTKRIIYALSIATFIITPLISMNRVLNTGDYLFLSGYSSNHYIEAAGIFIWCRDHLHKESKIITKLSHHSFSAYLIHVFFLEILKPIPLNLAPSSVMLLWFASVSVLSFAWSGAENSLKSVINIKTKR